jgi:prepilin-type N-terminal cleavage/methylation domain-containing protein
MSRPRSAFTLVEMLVVLGIIAVLAALLLPAAMGAVTRARNAAIGIEVNQLATAVESYKTDKGDYPPNMRPGLEAAFLAHVRRCYPKIAPSELGWFFMGTTPWPDGTPRFNPDRAPDEGEALVFWLSHTTTDPRYPFGLTVPANQTVNYKKYYEFDESRLESPLGDDPQRTTQEVQAGYRQIELPSYKAKFCKDTYYLYIDSRSYDYFTQNFASPPSNQPFYAYAEDPNLEEVRARPYWSSIMTERGKAAPPSANMPTRERFKPMNPTTFQILCAGQDGTFGLTEEDLAGPPNADLKIFPTGDYYSKADRDNITSFSAGKRLEDSVKQ